MLVQHPIYMVNAEFILTDFEVGKRLFCVISVYYQISNRTLKISQ